MPKTAKPYRLRLPGPTAVPDRIRQAMAAPVVAHRGPEFKEVLGEAEELARPLFGTENRIMAFTSSGTGLMEAAIANVLGAQDRALILVNGQFGERFAQITRALNLTADTIEVPWGEAVSTDAVAEKLRAHDYRAVVAVHNESSTGAVADLAAIGKVVGESDAVLVVDSISGLGGLELRQDEWGVDVLVTSSQKALMCPPGVALASISDKAWKVIDEGGDKPRFYWDFRRARDASEKGQTAFTSPMPLIYALREALRMIHEEGWAEVLARHRRVSEAMRTGGGALGLPLFTKAPIISDTVCVFAMPDGLDGRDVVRDMYENHGTVIAGSRTKLDGKVIRIGTMGGCSEDDIQTDLAFLEQTLDALGRRGGKSVRPGVAQAVAR